MLYWNCNCKLQEQTKEIITASNVPPPCWQVSRPRHESLSPSPTARCPFCRQNPQSFSSGVCHASMRQSLCSLSPWIYWASLAHRLRADQRILGNFQWGVLGYLQHHPLHPVVISEKRNKTEIIIILQNEITSSLQISCRPESTTWNFLLSCQKLFLQSL